MVVVLPQRRIPGLGVPMTPSELDAWGEDALKLLSPAPPRHSSRSRRLKDMWPLSVGLSKQRQQTVGRAKWRTAGRWNDGRDRELQFVAGSWQRSTGPETTEGKVESPAMPSDAAASHAPGISQSTR